MPSKKNQWRRRGRLEFRRETKRFHDGTPWTPKTDTLYVRIRHTACAIVEPFNWVGMPGKTTSVLCGTYRAASPIEAAHMAREYLIREEQENRNA